MSSAIKDIAATKDSFCLLLLQPSDRKCLCKQGYETQVGREQDCVQHVYDICGEGTSRTQEGTCLDALGWEDYCKNQVRWSHLLHKMFLSLLKLTNPSKKSPAA